MTKMGKIKILRIVDEFFRAGLQQGVRNIICNTETKKFENVIVSLKGVNEDMLIKGVKTYVLNKKPGLGWELPLRIARIIKKERPHILQMHNMDSLQQGMLATLLSDVPIKIYVDHNSFENKRSKKAVLLSRILSKRLDKAITVSDEVREKVVKELGVKRKKVKTILNGTDISKFDKKISLAGLRSELGISNKDKIVTIVAGLRKIKDHLTLIKAFSTVVKKEKNAKLIIVGVGEEKPRIQQTIEEDILENNVLLLGLRGDVPEILGVTDVSVICSLSEGISQTIMESMAASKPVVATNVGGNPVLVEEEVNGLLVPVKSSDKLAEAIARLLENKNLRAKMGKEGRKKIEEYFNVQRVCKDYETLYVELLNKKGVKCAE